MTTIEKIIARLDLVFDEVSYIENKEGLSITIKNKGKTKPIHYKAGTYEMPFEQYTDGNRGVEIQCSGIITDCVDEWRKK